MECELEPHRKGCDIPGKERERENGLTDAINNGRMWSLDSRTNSDPDPYV
jgi:hypothetical protein